MSISRALINYLLLPPNPNELLFSYFRNNLKKLTEWLINTFSLIPVFFLDPKGFGFPDLFPDSSFT